MTRSVFSICLNFIPNKTWFNDETRQIINNKNDTYRQYVCNGKLQRDCNSQSCISHTPVEVLKSSKEEQYRQLSIDQTILPSRQNIGLYSKHLLTVEMFRLSLHCLQMMHLSLTFKKNLISLMNFSDSNANLNQMIVFFFTHINTMLMMTNEDTLIPLVTKFQKKSKFYIQIKLMDMMMFQ